MYYPSYPVQSQNTSNECTLGVEENVRNVVDDVVSSHGVFVMNAISMLLRGGNIVP